MVRPSLCHHYILYFLSHHKYHMDLKVHYPIWFNLLSWILSFKIFFIFSLWSQFSTNPPNFFRSNWVSRVQAQSLFSLSSPHFLSPPLRNPRSGNRWSSYWVKELDRLCIWVCVRITSCAGIRTLILTLFLKMDLECLFWFFVLCFCFLMFGVLSIGD